MNRGLNEGSAKIYQFPAGGRAALGGRRRYGEANSVINTPRVNEVNCSGSWYHDEAIQQDNPNFKSSWDH